MNPGYDSRPSVPAATPKSDAVRLRMFEMTCGERSQRKCYSEAEEEMHGKMVACSFGASCDILITVEILPGYCVARWARR